MIKIKSIKFKDHDILGNLELDFCIDDNPADTIIIAGENGTGKTTILEEIYKVMNSQTDCKNLELNVLCDSSNYSIEYGEKLTPIGFNTNGKALYIINDILLNGEKSFQTSESIRHFKSIYSNVNINFSSAKIKTIKAGELDIGDKDDRKFDERTSTDIKQLFVDMVNYDNKIKAKEYDKIAKKIQNKINTNLLLKMDRFKNAFNFMFDDIKFKETENINGNIEILFEKNGKEISIDDLSSGEKQIVFRGAFLLRDKNALNSAVVLIDEPEISMHPKWQEKILDYYRNLFVDDDKKQTSQIIISTHSNFVIENALKLDNFVIVALQENNQPKKIMKNDGTFILPSVTAAEINYHVFDIASIDYHIQLFGYLQGITSIDKIENIDNKIKNNQSLLSKNVLQDSQGNACQWSYKKTTYDTICCFIRNAIDHPENLPNQTKKEYTEDDLRYSIEI
ncbi:MAG: AAA family ATPase, partial [Campylobacter sp.]|nr:AAA family ATPase [Campylobacter sp.]